MAEEERAAKLSALRERIETRAAERKARYSALVLALKSFDGGEYEESGVAKHTAEPAVAPTHVPVAADTAATTPTTPGSRGWAVIRADVVSKAEAKGIDVLKQPMVPSAFAAVVEVSCLTSREPHFFYFFSGRSTALAVEWRNACRACGRQAARGARRPAAGALLRHFILIDRPRHLHSHHLHITTTSQISGVGRHRDEPHVGCAQVHLSGFIAAG